MLIVKTTNGLYQSSHQEAKTTFNNFKGWHCGAGLDFLWISNDGEVYGNVCRHSGAYGSVYESVQLPTSPMICPASACYCASDIDILKSSELKDFDNMQLGIDTNSLPRYTGDRVLAVQAVRSHNTFRINWNIGKRCNFDCTYCPSTVHDNTSPHLNFATFKRAFDSIRTQISHDKVLSIVFTGGEPTINPDYMKIVEYAVSKNSIVFTNTNGTASLDKLTTLRKAGGLYLSIHTEFSQLDKLKRKIQKLSEIQNGQLVVKYMLPLGGLSRAIDFSNDMPNGSYQFKFNIEPLVDKGNNNKLLDYSKQELEFIRRSNEST